MADDVEMTPITADELPPKAEPFAAPAALAVASAPVTPAPAAPAPAAPAPAVPAPAAGGSTIRLKPVIRKPIIRAPGRPAPLTSAPASASSAPAAAEAVKKSTSNLKSLTAPIPAQAVLKKTGIVAEGIITPAQQQAAKSKTSRISLESAMGVAPVKESPAPLKTIRLRRPTDLKPAAARPSFTPKPLTPSVPAAEKSAVSPDVASPVGNAAPADAAKPETPVADLSPVSPAEEDATVTQKRTVKLHRPGVSLKRPTLGVSHAPSASADAANGDASVADLSTGDGADLQPIGATDYSSVLNTSEEKGKIKGLPSWLVAITSIAAAVALVLLGAATYKLYNEACGPDAGPNALASYDF